MHHAVFAEPDGGEHLQRARQQHLQQGTHGESDEGGRDAEEEARGPDARAGAAGQGAAESDGGESVERGKDGPGSLFQQQACAVGKEWSEGYRLVGGEGNQVAVVKLSPVLIVDSWVGCLLGVCLCLSG